MLIYNFQKEFLGIDEKDLRTLGFKNLQGLRTEVMDFSDLFVKTPGYIHNFKHVHWIDFITCAESNEESKVIINVNNKNYTASVHITTAFLVDNPSSKAYLVNLHNLRELTAKESEKISGDIVQRELPVAQQVSKQIFNTPEVQELQTPTETISSVVTKDVYEEEIVDTTLTQDPYESPLEINMDDDAPLEVAGFEDEIKVQQPIVEEEIVVAEEETYNDAPLEIDIEDDFQDISIEEEITPIQPTSHIEVVTENFDNGYVYDPSVASDELGLPLDLIEEFIQDFIEQAKEFKDDLYKHLDENDLDSLKILSHKLKGVAANLRIEDALETITVVNTESNINIISENLDTFYKIIAKLAGETISIEKEVQNEIQPPVENNNDELDLYVDPIEIEDIDVPIKIDMPELADDTFLNETETETETDATKEDDFNIEINIEDELELDEEEEEEDFKIDIDEEEEKDFKVDIEEDIQIATPIAEINYSKEAVADEIGLDIESFNELFEDYIQEIKELSTSVKDSITKDDIQHLQSDVIKFKGMSDNMRVEVFSTDIDTLLNSKNSDDLENAIQNIDKKIEQLSSREV